MVAFVTMGVGVNARNTFSLLATPRIEAIGGSTRSDDAVADDAGQGGDVDITADGSVTIGTITTPVANPGNPTFGAGSTLL